MAKKKEENIIEKVVEEAEEIVKKAGKKIEEVVEDVVEEAENVVGKKKSKKTKEKKEESSVKETKKSKLEELKEKAKALEKKVKEDKKGIKEIKGEVTGEKEEKKDMLVPIEDYLKSSIHLGTRVITPHMRPYVYRRRADGLAVFNTDLLDEKIKEGAKYLSQYNPEQIIVVCKREAGWKAVQKFADTLGIKAFTKKYPAGILTNTNLQDFLEADLVLICDPWLDKNALEDASKTRTKVMAICDTNNYTFGIEKIIPGNNKSAKSLGMVFYLLTQLYIENKKLKIKSPEIDEFIDDWANLQAPK